MIAEYLEHALQFERMSGETADPKLRDAFSSPGARLSQTRGRARSAAGAASAARSNACSIDKRVAPAGHDCGPDSRDKPLQSKPRDIYVADLNIDTLKLKARNFRCELTSLKRRKPAWVDERPLGRWWDT